MAPRPDAVTRGQRAFSLVEIALVLALVAILSAIAASRFFNLKERARKAEVITQLNGISKEVEGFATNAGRLPNDLREIGLDTLRDPWGNAYQYHRLDTVPRGQWRKDRFLVPINSDFDLWSMGPDGRSVPSLTALSSRDDIIRANDGSFYGLASDY